MVWPGASLSTKLTVAWDTPLAAATSRIVTRVFPVTGLPYRSLIRISEVLVTLARLC
ncbi:hypothetical protein GCM10010109_88030 [Actinoplanes campanulatus]|nr:hypothetical protein GCM10010109_88030 [Actinoplanes campanulatus]GID42266.1 hypothetical protein Aca09nite_87720 [Actinoplanes campanulatus]